MAAVDRIVVGIDGSAGAFAALSWAVEEAQRRSVELVVVHGWLLPQAAADPTGQAAQACEEAGEQILVDAVATVHQLAPEVTVTTRLVAATGDQAVTTTRPPMASTITSV